MAFIQPVSQNDLYNYQHVKTFNMIDNYIYLYHTDTLIALPMYPESVTDSMDVNFSPQNPLSSSAPIFSYVNSGPRSVQFELPLHRDMMNDINVSASKLNVLDLEENDYVDLMINQLQSIAVPRYAASNKLVNPPLIAVRLGKTLFCKGVVSGSVSVTHSGPILRTDKYAMATVTFSVQEVDPYDAESIAQQGSFRGLSTTLERRIWK